MNPTNSSDSVLCPICGKTAESGYVYGSDGLTGLRWRSGEPAFLGKLVGIFGNIEIETRGIRCGFCRRVVLECYAGEDGPGIELVMKASDLERDGDWDEALALYHRVLDEPRYQAHHEYARNGIKSIEKKKR